MNSIGFPFGIGACLYFFVVLGGCASLAQRSVDNRNAPGVGGNPVVPDERPVLDPSKPPVGEIDTDIEVPAVGTLQIEEKEGAHNFQVSYSYLATLKYDLKYKTTLAEDEFSKLPTSIKYAIYQDEVADYITEWVDTPRETIRDGSIVLADQSILKRLIPSQANVDLIFAVPDANGKIIPRYLLPLGTFCEQYEAKYFKNETDPAKTCFELTEAEVKAKAPDAFK